MDAGAYLKKQGWRGSGHSLDRSDRGIKKPLLIAHKQDQLGLGKKKQFVDDQWWMRAFDQSLQNIGTGQKSTLDHIREQGVTRGGLYSFFVKGEGLVGTISSAEDTSAAETSQSNSSASPSRTSTPATSAAEDENASDSDSKKRRKKESASETRKRRKLVKSDEKRGVNVPVSQEDAVDLTQDEEHVRQDAVRKKIDREVKAQIKRRLGKGEFGPHRNEQQAQEVKKQLKKELTIDAIMRGELPNPKNYTREELFQKVDKLMKNTGKRDKTTRQAEKAKRRKDREGKKAKLSASQSSKTKRREKKKAAHNKEESTEETAGKIEEGRPGEANDVSQPRGSTERKTRNINSPTPSLTPQHHLQLALVANQAAISAKLAKLSKAERIAYEERAAEKKQSLEQYVLGRIEKKKEKKAKRTRS